MRSDRSLLAALAPILAMCAVACGPDGPGTSVRVALDYDEALGLDRVEVTLTTHTDSAAIAHELLLLVSDDLAGMEVAIDVWGGKGGMRTVHGMTTAVPMLGKTVAAAVELSLPVCTAGCDGDTLSTCDGPTVNCALGCSEDGNPHCIAPIPSNSVDPAAADGLTGTTTISADTTFDTDTGAITGGFTRPAGPGIQAGVGYTQAPPSGPGGAPLAIFAFHTLAINSPATVRFTGSRAVVLLAGDTAAIGGVVEVNGGHGTRSTPGPGGGAGGGGGAPAGGCGPGAAGGKSGLDDGGGGGGGAGEDGGPGGGLTPALVGVGGLACLPAVLEPLLGGSGGGRSSAGLVIAAAGGGGGGALQITALRVLAVTGTINAGGAGGDGGAVSPSDGGGGGGGGSGGALLLESPRLTIGTAAILAANGGGGGGGGAAQPGQPGGDGGATDQHVEGGGGGDGSSTGGAGGATGSPPDVGRDGSTSGAGGGGGGGGVGRIVLRGHMRAVDGTISPPAAQLEMKEAK